VSDYEAACREATTNQGLDPVVEALTAMGIPHAVEQTGGFTMAVTVKFHRAIGGGDGTFAITCDVTYLLGFYAGTTWEDGEHEDAVYSRFIGTEALIDRVRRGITPDTGWRHVFPGYEVPTEIEEIEDLHDASDHRAACPSFADTDETVHLWIEHPDPAQRESGGERFAVTWDEDGSTEVYSGDDVYAALRVFRTTLHDHRTV
jgi:hypothetical protein